MKKIEKKSAIKEPNEILKTPFLEYYKSEYHEIYKKCKVLYNEKYDGNWKKNENQENIEIINKFNVFSNINQFIWNVSQYDAKTISINNLIKEIKTFIELEIDNYKEHQSSGDIFSEIQKNYKKFTENSNLCKVFLKKIYIYNFKKSWKFKRKTTIMRISHWKIKIRK